jgi:hypothetical protein
MDVVTGIVYDTSVQPPRSYSPVARGNRSLWSGQWYNLDVFLHDPTIPTDTTPVTFHHRPVRMGAFFQISQSSTVFPPDDPISTPQRNMEYYSQLFPTNVHEAPYKDIITSANAGGLTVTVSSGHGMDGSSISTWAFSSSTLNFSTPLVAINKSTRYRAELYAILMSLYIIYKAETTLAPHPSASINMQCSHATALKEAFRVSPLGIKTATQTNYDLLMDIRFLCNIIRSTIKLNLGAPPTNDSAPTTSVPSHDGILQTFLEQPPMTNASLVMTHTPMSHIVSVMHEGRTVGSDLKSFISNVAYSQPLQQKIQKDTGWTADQFQQVAWSSYFGAIRRVSRSH